jgi:hypothetical protein
MKKINYTLFGLIIGLFALNGFRKSVATRITINAPDSLVRTWGVQPKTNKKAEPAFTYYWYGNNQVHHTDGGFSGKLLHGKYESTYPNGQLKISGTFRYGIKNGEWCQWYPDGKIKERMIFSDGSLHGNYTLYTYNPENVIVRKFKHGNELTKEKKKGNDTIQNKTRTHKRNTTPDSAAQSKRKLNKADSTRSRDTAKSSQHSKIKKTNKPKRSQSPKKRLPPKKNKQDSVSVKTPGKN